MPQTTLKSRYTILVFVGLLFISGLALYIINNGINTFGIDVEVHKKDKFQYQSGAICLLSMLWFGLLTVKKKPKAMVVGLAVALVNSFSTFVLLGKIEIAYDIKLPYDIIALSSCIIMVFVLNKRYFSRIIE